MGDSMLWHTTNLLEVLSVSPSPVLLKFERHLDQDSSQSTDIDFVRYDAPLVKYSNDIGIDFDTVLTDDHCIALVVASFKGSYQHSNSVPEVHIGDILIAVAVSSDFTPSRPSKPSDIFVIQWKQSDELLSCSTTEEVWVVSDLDMLEADISSYGADFKRDKAVQQCVLVALSVVEPSLFSRPDKTKSKDGRTAMEKLCTLAEDDNVIPELLDVRTVSFFCRLLDGTCHKDFEIQVFVVDVT